MKSRFSTSLFIMVLVSFFAAALLPVASAQAVDERGVLVPAPMSPHGTLLDRTPTYKWSLVSGATIYQYQVWQGGTKLLDKSPDAEDVCGATTCEKSPAYSLSYNLFKWRVRAYKTGVWSAWSAFMEFNVSPAGFSNTFNNEMAGWAKKAGKDFYKAATYLYTPGWADHWSSIYRVGNQYTDFTYTARMKRAVGDSRNYIGIRMGTLVESLEGTWYPGYYFGYDNSGKVSIYKLNADFSSVLIYSGTTSLVNKYGWNTLKVKAIGWKFWYYINGSLVHYFTDTDYPRGYVGIAAYKQGSTSQVFYVDYANLNVLVTSQ